MKKNTQYISALEQKNFWRLIVDGKAQKIDPSIKQDTNLNKLLNEANYGHLFWAMREPHSLHFFKNTAQKYLSDDYLHQKLDFQFIKSVHDEIICPQDFFQSGILPTTEERIFSLKSQEVTDQQEEHLFKLSKSYDLDTEVFKIDKSNNDFLIRAQLTDETVIADTINKICTEYHEAIDNHTDNPDDIIEIICTTLQKIELVHPEQDGNIRTLYLILNKELMRHDLDPCILHDPNCLDFLCPEEMVEEVKKGQEAYQLFVNTGYPYDTNYIVEDEKITNNIDEIGGQGINLISMTSPNSSVLNSNNYMKNRAVEANILQLLTIEQIFSTQNIVEKILEIQKNAKDPISVLDSMNQLIALYRDSVIAHLIKKLEKAQKDPEFINNFKDIASELRGYTKEDFLIFVNNQNNLKNINDYNLMDLINYYQKWINEKNQLVEEFQVSYSHNILDPMTCHLPDNSEENDSSNLLGEHDME